MKAVIFTAVNQNLTSTGFMTADQKKKLLWGKKKTTVTEEVLVKFLFYLLILLMTKTLNSIGWL